MTPDTQYDILVAGEINPDLILTGNVTPEFGQVEKLIEDATLAIGSSSVITACGAARLGLRVAFVGVCGDDLWGRFMLEEMQKRGVDTSAVMVDPHQSTGLTVILNKGGDRAMLTFAGAIGALRAEDISDALLGRARHLHVASYFLQDSLRPGLPALFRRARALGLSTSLDTNYDPSEQWTGFDNLLAVTNILLPNETEARSLTAAANIDEAADRLRSRVEVTAIKLGADGALGVTAAQTVRVASIPVRVVDTVGAGDSFNAGFLYGYLNGWPMEKSLRLACVCGALSTQRAGGTSGQPTLAEAMEYVS